MTNCPSVSAVTKEYEGISVFVVNLFEPKFWTDNTPLALMFCCYSETSKYIRVREENQRKKNGYLIATLTFDKE